MIGTTVGSYRITRKVSVGGMGTVFKAEHTLIGKAAAVKVLHAELRNNRDVVNRFFNEAKATTQIKHPGIVEVFDFGYLPSGDGYIVMEFLEGVSLARRIKTRGPLEEGEAAMLLRSVCSALAAAHAKGIVHRDLKPDNIFLTPDPESALGERPKLLDFGIAKLSDVALGGPTSATKTGAVMGTPTYMSPEQCKGTGEIDHRADLYAIGCIHYELLCGRPPFTNMGAGELIGAHLYIDPVKPSLSRPGISADSEQLIMELLAKSPDDRPRTARELGQRYAKIAQLQGWITITSPSGVTAVKPREPIPADEGEDEDEDGADVASSPPATTSDAISPTVPSDVGPAPQPTTLSGAASQSVVGAPRRRGAMIAVMGAAVVVVGAAIGVAAVKGLGGGGQAVKPAPAAQPAVAAPTPAPAPPPPPVVHTTPPAPPPPAPVVETPPPAPPPPAPPKKLATPHHPAATAPKHATKPVDKPGAGSGSGSGSGSGHILIETDI
ncbi:MAG TPA: serine/threonine-protein kinase [Kofleriaceae bacterium]|nr:serine/threonine-protein kinase [Kofleriaceae bacterium]